MEEETAEKGNEDFHLGVGWVCAWREEEGWIYGDREKRWIGLVGLEIFQIMERGLSLGFLICEGSARSFLVFWVRMCENFKF